MNRSTTAITVQDGSQVAEARRAATACAAALGMSEVDAGKAALIATELTTNLIKHGGGGQLLIGPTGNGATPSLDLVAVDRGEGIANVDAALRDGFSTAGSPGTGLGALRRQAAAFDIYSHPGKGTAVLCRIAGNGTATAQPPRFPAGLAVRGICVAKKGESVSGDSWTVTGNGDTATILIADGLGHGPMANEASMKAVRCLLEMGPDESLEAIADAMHGALRPTRGAAVGMARIHPLRRTVAFLGIGNIAGAVFDEGQRKVVSQNGIVGHEMRKKSEFTYPWSDSAVLLLASDGLGTSWNPNDYPGLMTHDPGLIAAVFYRDYCRGTDDVTVVVARGNA
jgi:anti-sigma regulatory factor (Ser/Thr protein kinase)